MKSSLLSPWLLMPLLWLSGGDAKTQDENLTGKSRELVAAFAAQLKPALSNAINSGGPVAAIEVCKDMAPRIGAQISRQSGAKVSRTSLKVRNPANAPEPWQREILLGFEAAVSRGIKPQQLEHAESTPTQTGTRFRYMKAIPTTALCLTCHGQDLSPQIQQTLAEHYPYDRATGYVLGDVRGAFSVVWPNSEGDNARAIPASTPVIKTGFGESRE